MILLLGCCLLALFFSYPALSHDIFNYLFNAKMVLLYKSNPHVQVAIDFPKDPWLAFMHNVHTPAPYGYGWTIISLIPAMLGKMHLQTTMLWFRAFVTGWFILLIWLQGKVLTKDKLFLLSIFAFNPLVLIETVSNIHNDVVMMALALASMLLVMQKATGLRVWLLRLLAVMLFALSVSIKLATIMIIPGYIIWWFLRKSKINISFFGIQTASISLPLITPRSQLFLPWYLIWPFSLVVLAKEKLFQEVLLLFSISAMLSYIPYLYYGEYSPQLIFIRSIIIFLPPLSYLLTKLLLAMITPREKTAKRK